MKTLSLLCFILVFLPHTAFSQSCLPDGIVFTSQAQIDNFQANYPGCTEIEGSVQISGDGVSNLEGLSTLTYIGGYLWIGNNNLLTSLNGLNGVNSIGGYLYIGATYALANLTGLENLTAIGSSLKIGYNPNLADLTGIESLTSIGSDLSIHDNA